MMRSSVLLVALLAAGCGGSSSTAPAPIPVPTPTSNTVTLAGVLTGTNSGTPLSSVAMDFGIATATSSANGAFSVSLPATASTLALTISGVNVLTRRAYVTPGARTVNLDAIQQSGFDLAFYRAFVRNGFEQPAILQPLRRLTHAPLVYVRTIDEAGQPVDAATLRSTIDAVWSVGSAWSGGAFGIADVPSGTDTREGQPGWLTVKWLNPPIAGLCGQSDVGRDGGTIELNPLVSSGCACNGSKIRPATVRHELGHAFGYWHTGDAGDLMSGLGTACDQQPSARELANAKVAYKRPIGNVDPDNDPSTAVNLAPMRAR